jgi:hypothetical protein
MIFLSNERVALFRFAATLIVAVATAAVSLVGAQTRPRQASIAAAS